MPGRIECLPNGVLWVIFKVWGLSRLDSDSLDALRKAPLLRSGYSPFEPPPTESKDFGLQATLFAFGRLLSVATTCTGFAPKTRSVLASARPSLKTGFLSAMRAQETLEALANLPSKAAEGVQKQIKASHIASSHPVNWRLGGSKAVPASWFHFLIVHITSAFN